jgi:hypothetical protein
LPNPARVLAAGEAHVSDGESPMVVLTIRLANMIA